MVAKPCGGQFCLHSSIRRGRGALTRLLVAAALMVAAADEAHARRGIVEDGRLSQQLSGSTFRVTVDGIPFEDPNHAAGETAATMFARIRSAINAHPTYCAAGYTDPADPNRAAMSILRDAFSDPNCATGAEVISLEWFEDDPNVTGAVVHFPTGSGQRFNLRKVDAVAGNGAVNVDVTLAIGGLLTHSVSTAGKTAAQVNADLAAALSASGFSVTDGVTQLTVTMATDAIRRVVWNHSDTGVNVSGLRLESVPLSTPPAMPLGYRRDSPTLTEAGIVVLVVLTALAGALVLAGRHGAGAG